jgi:hypothetical protein
MMESGEINEESNIIDQVTGFLLGPEAHFPPYDAFSLGLEHTTYDNKNE